MLWLFTQAGFRTERMGAVIGSDADLARAAGVSYSAMRKATKQAVGLGLAERIPATGRRRRDTGSAVSRTRG
ncbi:MAG: hypothetical protein LC789_11630 [Actinobacteria bacterium]|nr:hypothetical protein [Actinomycetota bacterium]